MNIEMKQYVAGTKDSPHMVVGNWIWDDEGYSCSVCLNHVYGETGEIVSGHWHFCPVCGSYLIDKGDT